MTFSMDLPRSSQGGQHTRDPRIPAVPPPETTARDTRTAVPETSDGDSVQVLELRGTIIRLRERLDQIHLNYEERVQRLESMHRAQCRELEETIRHLRDRLQTPTDTASGV